MPKTPPPQICDNDSFCETASGEDELNCPQDCPAPAEPQPLCNPGSRRCYGDELKECNPTGTSWTTKESCTHGCNVDTIRCNAPPSTSENIWPLILAAFTAVAIISAIVYLRKRKAVYDTKK